MPKERSEGRAEGIVAKLCPADVLTSRGAPPVEAIRTIGVSEVRYHRWRNAFGGLKLDEVRRLKELELENGRLRKAVSDLTLEELLLAEALRGN